MEPDHRKLGQELDLFTFSDLVGAGLPLFTPKGTLIYHLLDDFVWQLRQKHGYQKVEIPHITKKELYVKSGHWEKFENELFKIKSREGHDFAIKPMNCPHHTQIFARKPHSYREMPARYANTTMCYRDEQTGQLNGLSRVRSVTQDDAHVFCRQNQIKEEFARIWDIVDQFYSAFGFNLQVRLSLHDPDQMDRYLGTPDTWKIAEDTLRQIAQNRGVKVEEARGEAAFYGPKIDFVTQDSLNRDWQVATIQLDMNLPDRFDLTCINEKGQSERIFMIHAAIMGSIERFLSVLLEHLAGNLPVWLSPVQIAVLPLTDEITGFAQDITQKLQDESIRIFLDDSHDTLSKKILTAERQKIPYMLIVGQKEKDANTVSVRARGEKNLGPQSLDQFLSELKAKIETKALE